MGKEEEKNPFVSQDPKPKPVIGASLIPRTLGGITIDLKVINRVLVFVLGVLMVFVGYNIFGHRPGTSELTQKELANTGPVVHLAPLQDFMPLGSYTQQAEKRDVFHPIPPPQPPAPPPVKIKAPEPPKVDLHALIKDLSLAGVYVGEDREVMIEDKSAKKMYILKEGGRIRNFRVKTILNDRVILQLGDDQVELL